MRYTLRTLIKSPGWTLAAVLCLAIGIGANTTVYSATNALVLHPVPARNADGLVMLSETPPRGPDLDFDRLAPANLLDWQRATRTLERIAAFAWWDVNVTDIEEPERVTGFRVSPEFFRLLDERPMIGRAFTPEEAATGNTGSVILGYPLWQRRFGGDPTVVGRTVRLNGEPHTIVGIMSADFIFPAGAELWAPLALDGARALDRDGRWLRAIGRLKTGVSIEQARSEAKTIAARLAAQYPDMNGGWGMQVEPADRFYGRHPRPYMLVLLGAVAFVLLIACANVANLLLTRAMGRGREVAVRVALGATRGHIVRQFLTESTVIAFLGGTLGVLLSLWGTLLFRSLLPSELLRFNPGWTRISVDSRALVFTAAVSLATALIIGVVPAIFASRADPQRSLKDGGRGSAGPAGRSRLRSALVVGEIALSLMLLVGTVLMLRSFVALMSGDPGYRVDRALTMQLTLPAARYKTNADVTTFFTNLIDRLGELPGVTAAGVASALPPSWNDAHQGIVLEGQPQPRRGEPFSQVRFHVVSAGYFEAMGIEVRRGRSFTRDDDASSPRVVVVSEALARRYWPNADAIGKRFTIRGDTTLSEVVGIVRDVRHNPNTGGEPLGPVMFIPLPQAPWRTMMAVVRTAADPTAAAPEVQRAIARLDPALAPGDVLTLERVVQSSVTPQRATAQMLAAFAVIALLLAVIGIYGVMSYTVAQRTREIGVRVALGAQRGEVVRHVLRQGAVLVVMGLIIGLGGSAAMTRGLATLLHDIAPTDPVSFVAGAFVLCATALLGCYLPARRAAAVDPVVALRDE